MILAASAGTAQYGIGHPENTGDCELFIGALDESGKVLEDIALKPGDSRHWYWPPTGTAKLYAVCSKTCHGTAVLEYDTPIG